MEDSITARLTQVFRDVFHDDALVLSRSLTAGQVKGWDSLGHLNLMLSVQRAFRIRLTASEVSQLADVGELIDLIRAKQDS